MLHGRPVGHVQAGEIVRTVEKAVEEKLLYRRQFVLGPKGELPGFGSWERLDVSGTHHLSVHPDLPVYQATREGKSITLLGYMLDPDHPGASDSDILESLIGELDSFSAFIPRTSRYGGRWILIVNDGKETVLFHDAAGLRQICYALSPASGETWCASQPGPIADIFRWKEDEKASEYMKAREEADHYNPTKVYWFPGDTTMYREIRALLPNHFLNLGNGESVRYWPAETIGRIPLRKGVGESVRTLRGLMESARRRYSLSLSMTAGWDSRLMLALSKDNLQDMYCFTLSYPGTKDNDMDIGIPSALCGKFGVVHHLLHSPADADPEFRNIYRKNSPSITQAYHTDAQAIHDTCPPDRVCVTGDVAEVTKCYLRLPGAGRGKVSAHDLAMFASMGSHPFVIEAFDQWISSLPELSDIHPLDLFSWEQVGGRWQALNQAGYDIALESFSPYNCRRLLTSILSVAEKHRLPPFYIFHRKLIAGLWEECLSEPINPPQTITPKTVLLDFLVKSRIYRLIPGNAFHIAKNMYRKLAK